MLAAPDGSELDRFVRLVCVFFAASSFPLAGWLLVAPDAFWSSLGVGGNAFAQALYGGAIAGEGAMFLLGALRPARYRVFFEYMLVYKSVAVLAGLRVWLVGGARSTGALAILGGWAVAGLISAIVVVPTDPNRARERAAPASKSSRSRCQPRRPSRSVFTSPSGQRAIDAGRSAKVENRSASARG